MGASDRSAAGFWRSVIHSPLGVRRIAPTRRPASSWSPPPSSTASLSSLSRAASTSFCNARGVEFVALWLVERGGYGLERAFDVGVAGHVAAATRAPRRASRMSGGLHRRRRAGFPCGRPGSGRVGMPKRRLIAPFLRQLDRDPLGLGRSAQSARSERLAPRTRTADKVVQSVCPYCAVGCGQRVYVKDEKVDPDRGRSGLADLPRPAVPEGLGVRAARQLADARDAGQVPPSGRHRVGVPLPRAGDRDDRRAADPDPRGDLGGGDRRRRAAQADARACTSSAARRSTARRTT